MVDAAPVRVMFVCLGNICRSPTAHGVFRDVIQRHNLQELILVDSSGTGDWHVGHAPDVRATSEAQRRGFDISDLRAIQVTQQHFLDYDYVLAMDDKNLSDLNAMRPKGSKAIVTLFLGFSSDVTETEVPDPYYGGDEGFARVFDMIESASEGLLEEIVRARLAP